MSPPVTTSVEILIVYHQTDTVHWQIMPLYNVNNLPFERHANESMTFDRYVCKRNDDALVIPVRARVRRYLQYAQPGCTAGL